MITREINKYNIPIQTYPIISYFDNTKPVANEMGKLEYALFIRNLPFKIGDLIVPIIYLAPYYAHDVVKLISIDEIHRLVKYLGKEIGPLCLRLEEVSGKTRPAPGGALLYKKVDHEHIPLMWKGRDIVDV